MIDRQVDDNNSGIIMMRQRLMCLLTDLLPLSQIVGHPHQVDHCVQCERWQGTHC